MDKRLTVLFFLFSVAAGRAQVADSIKSVRMEPVTVTSYKEEPIRETSLNITPLGIDSLTRYGNFNLTELLARNVPGVTMLTTGVAIAKPVIRGLYGNRVLVLLSGLKFDNQQWQEEHGLGLSDIGLSKVELIKGPMSVLYGTEAMGGIINLVDEQKAQPGTQEGDFSVKFNSNTLGGLVQGGYKRNNGKNWFRVRVGIENNGDYTDGAGHRVLNSRFDGYYLKAGYGFTRKNWTSENRYSASFNRFGFIFNDIYTFITPDARWSRQLDKNPAHFVILNILSSENKIALKHNDLLSVNVGLQSNQRMENEGGGAISLNMHLFTFQYLIKWEKRLNEKNRIVLSHLGSIENNTNFGARKIVPDANMQEGNISLYHELNLNNKLILENGIGVGEKYIKTYYTPTVNGPGKDIEPFGKFSVYYNAYSGLSYNPISALNLKVNVATGVRIPNLAELSSDGLHEGVFTYEIGNPNLKNEQSLSANFALRYVHRFFELDVSPFYTYFFNYVYLAPTTEQWFGFPVYRYRQQDARQYGGEITAKAKPVKNLELGLSYSGMISQTTDGQYTPYLPAQKFTPAVRYQFAVRKDATLQLYTNADYCFAQNLVYPGEITTPAYFLLNAGLSSNITRRNQAYEVGLTGTNLTDKKYYDHLSRFKNYGLYNIGINFVIFVKVKFINTINKK